MTAATCSVTGAPTGLSNWDTIKWSSIQKQVKRLQMRIAKAIREGRHGKAKALQWLLTHSFAAKLLAVKRVTQSKGAKTPGVDGVVWSTPKKKYEAAIGLRRRGYRAQPLKRIYIPKRNGQRRPLSIPVLHCRAQQALYLLSLEPVTETRADGNAYGFRPKRSTADAIEQCFIVLARKTSATFVLEGDIKSCFDTICHKWMVDNIMVDSYMLTQWLKAGYIEMGNDVVYPTDQGVPQGGVISPAITVATLSGFENAVKTAIGGHRKVNVVAYADDFVITGVSRDILVNEVKPAVESFLHTRGLSLSKDKTQITRIDEGFDFLGFNIRKYKEKLLIKPAKGNVISFLRDIRKLIKSHPTAKTENLIHLLNPKLRGWANYYAHVVSKRTFSYVSSEIFWALWRWAKRRHPTKRPTWIKQKYFCCVGNRQWVFFCRYTDKSGVQQQRHLFNVAAVKIKRHVKIRSEANPYDPSLIDYFNLRD